MASQIHKDEPAVQALQGAPKYKVARDDLPIKEDLTLDPDTAHPLLEISADEKEVQCVSTKKNVIANSKRFETAICMVARQSFTYGQHYWEVRVDEKPRWNLGIVSDLAERKGRVIHHNSCTEGYWMIGYNKKNAGKKYRAFDTNPMPFDCHSHPKIIGIYLDYEGGEVTFYNADSSTYLSPLYSFYNVDFKKDPVYPFFDPCSHDDGGNSQPLRIV